MVYAIVKAGGRQEKVSVGDVVVVDRLAGEVGDEIDLVPLMLVDGDTVTTAAADLAKASVKPILIREKDKQSTKKFLKIFIPLIKEKDIKEFLKDF